MLESSGGFRALRATALFALVAGALGSIGFLLRVGRTSPPLLIGLFLLWVLSPFVVLAVANAVSSRWSISTRAALYVLMLVVAVCSLLIYGDVALGPPRAKNAPPFVVTPPASWLLIAVTLAIAALTSRRRG